MDPRSATVLITGAGTVTCQSVIKGLRTQEEIDVTIVTVDASRQVAGRYFSDYFYCVPRAGDPDFVPTLLALCQAHEVRLLVPIVDYEFTALSRARALFAAQGCLVAISAPEVIQCANDKLATYRFFQRHGFDHGLDPLENAERERVLAVDGGAGQSSFDPSRTEQKVHRRDFDWAAASARDNHASARSEAADQLRHRFAARIQVIQVSWVLSPGLRGRFVQAFYLSS